MIGGRDGPRPATGHRGFAPAAGIVLLCLTLLVVVVGTVLLFGGGDFSRVVWGMPGAQGLWALGFSVAGYPITRRHPANPVGWCLMVAGAAAGVALLGTGVPEAAGLGERPLWLMNFWVISVSALCTAVVLFPSGSPPSRRWWMFLGVLWGSGSLEYFKAYPTSPEFVGLPERLDVLAIPTNIVFQTCTVVQFLALLARWRRAGAVERLQLKWVVYSVALVATAALVVEVGLANLVSALYPPATVVFSVAVIVIPTGIGVAMLRYRLYDIDLLINRTLVYGLLTAMLAAVYFGGVVGLQSVLRGLTGQESTLAVVASTLAIAALFNPLRRRVQAFVDRRFYRRKYDAAKILAAFNARLRDETDLGVLSEDLVGVVHGTVQPQHASLWLRPEAAAKDGARTD